MFEKLKNLLVEEMSINEADIVPDAELMNDLGMNSLELADLVMLCEENFDMTFDERDLPTIVTIKDLVNYLEAKSEEAE